MAPQSLASPEIAPSVRCPKPDARRAHRNAIGPAAARPLARMTARGAPSAAPFRGSICRRTGMDAPDETGADGGCNSGRPRPVLSHTVSHRGHTVRSPGWTPDGRGACKWRLDSRLRASARPVSAARVVLMAHAAAREAVPEKDGWDHGNRSPLPGSVAHAVRSILRAPVRADAPARGPRRHHRGLLPATGAGLSPAVRARAPGRRIAIDRAHRTSTSKAAPSARGGGLARPCGLDRIVPRPRSLRVLGASRPPAPRAAVDETPHPRGAPPPGRLPA